MIISKELVTSARGGRISMALASGLNPVSRLSGPIKAAAEVILDDVSIRGWSITNLCFVVVGKERPTIKDEEINRPTSHVLASYKSV